MNKSWRLVLVLIFSQPAFSMARESPEACAKIEQQMLEKIKKSAAVKPESAEFLKAVTGTETGKKYFAKYIGEVCSRDLKTQTCKTVSDDRLLECAISSTSNLNLKEGVTFQYVNHFMQFSQNLQRKPKVPFDAEAAYLMFILTTYNFSRHRHRVVAAGADPIEVAAAKLINERDDKWQKDLDSNARPQANESLRILRAIKNPSKEQVAELAELSRQVEAAKLP